MWGLVTGWGLDQNVKEAYRFLVENYDNGKRKGVKQAERDRIFIFGFSRGAYSARVLAGFIHAVWLIEPRNLNLLNYAYRAYKAIGEDQKQRAFDEVRLYERILNPDRPPIRMLGLFDTVGSVIESGRNGVRLKSHAFTERNSSVEAVSHAVAIDEKRTMFRPQLWPSDQQYWGNPFNSAAARLQDVEEVWFAGGHGDVGGDMSGRTSSISRFRKSAASSAHCSCSTGSKVPRCASAARQGSTRASSATSSPRPYAPSNRAGSLTGPTKRSNFWHPGSIW